MPAPQPTAETDVRRGSALDAFAHKPGFLKAEVKLYDYAQLKGVAAEWLPEGVDPRQREQALKDIEFLQIFGCTKEAFAGWPEWKKVTKRKEFKLH